MSIDALNVNARLENITIPTLSIYDYMNMESKQISESKLIKVFNVKLDKVENSGSLTEYETELKNIKHAKQVKNTSYKMIALGTACTLEKWDKDIKPYLDRLNYPYEAKEFTDYIPDKDNKGSVKPIQKVKITNNLKRVKTEEPAKIKEVVSNILEYFQLSEEQINGFNEILKLIDTTTSTEEIEKLREGHFLKANSGLYQYNAKLVLNRTEKQLNDVDTYINKLEASINFINWKLKQIRIRKNKAKSVKLDKDFIEYEKDMQFKLKEDKTFSSLYSIAEKYGLNARPKKA